MTASGSLIIFPKAYRQHLSAVLAATSDARYDASSIVSGDSWRTFRTISAPSETLSYTRGAVGSLTGRALNRFGEIVLAPFENRTIRRELKGLIRCLDLVNSEEGWSEVEAVMGCSSMIDRVLEPLRPMYPQEIRLLAHEVVHILMVRKRFKFSILNLPEHFSTRNEYQRCVSAHGNFLLALYPNSVIEGLLVAPDEASQFLSDLKEHLSHHDDFTRSTNSIKEFLLPQRGTADLIPSIPQSLRAIARLAEMRGVTKSTQGIAWSEALEELMLLRSRKWSGSQLEILGECIQDLDSLVNADERVKLVANHILESNYCLTLSARLKDYHPHHLSILDPLSDLGLINHDQARLAEADSLLRLALDGYLTTLGAEHRSTHRVIRKLALVRYDQGQFDAAEGILGELKGHRRVRPTDISTINALLDLSFVSRDCGEYVTDEVDSILSKYSDFGSFEKRYGSESILTFKSYRAFGVVCHLHGELEKAEDMLSRALAGFERLLCRNHALTVLRHCFGTVQDLGLVFAQQGRLKIAEQMFDRSCKGFREVFGPDHRYAIQSALNLGIVYRSQGRLSNAEWILNHALAGLGLSIGKQYTKTFDELQETGREYMKRGAFDKAIQILERVFLAFDKVISTDYRATHLALEIGNLYKQRKRFGKAERFLHRALLGFERLDGLRHISTLESVFDLGIVYREQGRYDMAVRMLQRARVGFEAACRLNPSQSRRGLLSSIHGLGLLYTDQGRLDDAQELLCDLMRMIKVGLVDSEVHSTILGSVRNLGLAFQDQDRLDKARDVLSCALDGCIQQFGQDDALTIDIAHDILLVRNEERSSHIPPLGPPAE